MLKFTKVFVILMCVIATQTACWVTAQEGTVQVRTINDRIDLIIRPDSGGVYSWNVWWDQYYPVSLRENDRDRRNGVKQGQCSADAESLGYISYGDVE